jgi:PEP-CTERM motif
LRFSTLSLALSGLLLVSVAAKADTFNFSAAGGGFSGSGQLTADNNGDGSYTVTGITGTGVTGLIPVDGFFFNDNLLFPNASRLVDVAGLGFTAAFGGETFMVNIFSTLTGYEAITLDSDSDFADTPITFSLTNSPAAVPEPSSLVLLGSGFLASVVVGVRRRLGV